MSIKKEVILRSEIMTIYSSEMQERMKVYFKLQEKYEECSKSCRKSDQPDNNFCEETCSKIFDEYSETLYSRYKEAPEKLDEVVQNSPIFEYKQREHTKGLFYQIFHK